MQLFIAGLTEETSAMPPEILTKHLMDILDSRTSNPHITPIYKLHHAVAVFAVGGSAFPEFEECLGEIREDMARGWTSPLDQRELERCLSVVRNVRERAVVAA